MNEKDSNPSNFFSVVDKIIEIATALIGLRKIAPTAFKHIADLYKTMRDKRRLPENKNKTDDELFKEAFREVEFDVEKAELEFNSSQAK